jgi:hypothetical protein
MTSKAAKKAYREANKLSKISKAEQRRIEAAEIARQNKEYEKEKAAAKAKIAREKKLKKEAEERAKRKELGLPEPSRFVRPSQPTIKTFVKSAGGQKRSWEEMNSKEEDDVDITVECDNDKVQLKKPVEKPANRVAVKQVDEDDEFGDFPSLSQADLPTLFAEPDDASRTVSIEAPTTKSPLARLRLQSVQYQAADHTSMTDHEKPEAQMAESDLLIEAKLARTKAPSLHQCQPSTSFPNVASSLHETMTEVSAGSSSATPKPDVQKVTSPAIQTNGRRKTMDERLRTMPPPTVPMTVNRLTSRVPLGEVPRNMGPLPLPPKVQAVTSARKAGGMSEQKLRRATSCIPPPSTLAFLEAHLDDFFPSPSQQIRELLEEVDDMPSNTQTAREIDLVEQDSIPVQDPHIPSPLPRSQNRIEDESLHFLSSQDLEISSQDLRDIDTPSKAMPKGSLVRNLTTQIIVLTEVTPEPPPTPKLKPRFFEEKEDDLLYAALHDSLLLSKQTTQRSSPRKSQRILRRSQSSKTDRGCDDYGSDGSDLDADFLALLDDA